MIDPGLLLQVATVAVTGGAAYGGVKAALNGTKEKLTKVADDLDVHVKHDALIQIEMVDRLARIETKIDQQ